MSNPWKPADAKPENVLTEEERRQGAWSKETVTLSQFVPPLTPDIDIEPTPQQVQGDTGLPVGLVSYAQAAQVTGLTPQDIHNAVRSGVLTTPSAAEMKGIPKLLQAHGIVYRRELIRLAPAGLP